MRYLRTNTATRITVGPFLDKTDGVTPETALTVTACKLTLMVDTSDVPTLILDTAPTASGGANDMVHVTGDDAGFYDLELAAANVNYLGRAMLAITDAATHCPVFHEFMIVPAHVYDGLFLGTDNLQVDTVQITGTAQTARDIGASVLLSNGTGTGQVSITSGVVSANAVQLSGDSAAADNAEAFFDGTGYAGTNNTIPSVTTVTTVNGLAANTITAAALAADAVTEIQSGLSTLTQAQVTGGAYSIQSASCVLGDARIANLDATVSSRSTYAGADTAGTTTLLSRVIGTIATGTHNPQTGDAYAIVASGTHGNAALKTLVDDVPTVAEFEARTLAAADYFDPAADKVYLGDGAQGGSSMVLTFQKIVGASSGNDPCITITGSGTGEGILVNGGETGSGIEVNAGAGGHSGIYVRGHDYGFYARATYLTGTGICGRADGIGPGIRGDSSSGYGMSLSGNTGSTALYLGGAVVATHASNDIRGIQVNDFTTSAKALLQTEANDALVANHLDHLLAVDYDPEAKPGVATSLLNELIGNDVGVSQFTANALELAPTGGSAPTVGQIADEVQTRTIAAVTLVNGLAANTITAAALAADAVTEIQSGLSTLTQAQVTGGAYSIQSASCVLGDARIANLDATVSSRLATAGYTSPPSAGTISTQVASDLAAAHGAGSWATAVGFSTHSAADVVTAIGTGSTLSAIPWNASWDAEVQSEVQDAIEVNHLDHLLAADYDPAAKPGVATALLNELIGDDLGVSQFTANALELAPTGGSAPTVEQIRAEIDSNSTQLAAIVADTNELQTDLTNGGRLDLILDDILTDTGTTLQAELDGIQADTEDIQSRLPAALVSGRMDSSVGAMAANVVTASALATDAVTEIFAGVLTSQMTESYAADGVAPTLAQAVFLIQQSITEFTISGTTTTIKKLDGSTTAATLTLNDGTTPTGVTRAT